MFIDVIRCTKYRALENGRTRVLLDTEGSTRWTLAINAYEIEDFTFKRKRQRTLIIDLATFELVVKWSATLKSSVL